MKPVLTILLTFSIAWAFSMAAVASDEVDAKPGPKDAYVLLEGQSFEPGSNSTANTANTANIAKSQTIWDCSGSASTGNFLVCEGNGGIGFFPTPTGPAATLEGEILTAVREIGLPSLKIRIQPGDETLVNLDTIFHTRPQPFQRSVTLLGFDIDLIATPVGYTWRHGDGSTHSTRKPGRPYPSKDVTWRYQKAAKNLRPSVDVTYGVRYRIDGGAWQNLSQTLQANGPAGELDVREATPVLAKP